MAAGTFTLYRANLDDLRIQDLVGATVKVALVTSSYTPNAANNGHSLWSDASSNEIANGNGYNTGGVTPGSLTTSLVTNGHNFDSADPSWTATLSGTDSLYFDTVADTLDQAGDWRLQAKVVIGTGTWRGETVLLTVYPQFA